jgi:N-acetyl-gamma-glutamyl-phosphate reductase
MDERTRRVVVVAVIDNLTRGASGQAVCNMNLMSGLPEDAGLTAPPWQP